MSGRAHKRTSPAFRFRCAHRHGTDQTRTRGHAQDQEDQGRTFGCGQECDRQGQEDASQASPAELIPQTHSAAARSHLAWQEEAHRGEARDQGGEEGVPPARTGRQEAREAVRQEEGAPGQAGCDGRAGAQAPGEEGATTQHVGALQRRERVAAGDGAGVCGPAEGCVGMGPC